MRPRLNRFGVGVFLWIGTSILFGLSARAQAPSGNAKDEVMQVVQHLFDGMRAGDSSQVRSVFVEQARLMTVQTQEEGSRLHTSSVDAFVTAVGKPHDAVWDERIWDVDVHVDGPMAAVWAPYAFYLGDALSHCGVNAFQLVRSADGWRIVQITDTRREEGCEVPAPVRK